jgi:hypothetical protein
MNEPDEFTIPRPRWVVPVAVIGAVLLFLGLVVGRIAKLDDDEPTPARTGGVPTTVVVTTTR